MGCRYCGRKHGNSVQCLARRVKCYKCGFLGHYARVCKARNVAALQDDGELKACDGLRESLLCNLSIDEVRNHNSWFEDVLVHGVKINFKLDSGAEASVLSLRAFREAGFDVNMLKKNNCTLREVSKTKLPVVGYFEPVLSHGKLQCRQKVYVLNLNCKNLLGVKACRDLKLIIRNNKNNCEISKCKIDEQAYKLNLVFKPGRLMYIADTLSRAAVEKGTRTDSGEHDVTIHINAMYENMDAANEKLEKIKEETQKDLALSSVINYYYEGWPNDKHQVIALARPFWTFRHGLHEINGLLFFNKQVVIPTSMRSEMLKRIHEGHLGIEKCKRRARDAIFWPGMGSQIKDVVQQCDTCQRHLRLCWLKTDNGGTYRRNKNATSKETAAYVTPSRKVTHSGSD